MSDRRSDPADFNDSVIREFRANRGVVGGELADMSLLLLTTIGAWSGRPRTTPLAYHRRGHRYLVIASNAAPHVIPTGSVTSSEIRLSESRSASEPSPQGRRSSRARSATPSSRSSPPRPRRRRDFKRRLAASAKTACACYAPRPPSNSSCAWSRSLSLRPRRTRHRQPLRAHSRSSRLRWVSRTPPPAGSPSPS